MNFQPADYVLGVFTAFLALGGLFRGFSGMFAMLVAGAASFAAATWAWPASAGMLSSVWQRGFAVCVCTLLVFGVVRIVVKKTVGGLLDQPLDAIFGCAVGLVCAALAILAISAVPEARAYSLVARGVAWYVW